MRKKDKKKTNGKKKFNIFFFIFKLILLLPGHKQSLHHSVHKDGRKTYSWNKTVYGKCNSSYTQFFLM
ncbi:hypothetical protein BLA29_004182 [Euroglyphus maynei]|uniref:Uncharacterized protein n=1 Tax=Euroglyphus maynei TaxID=6958 RepID=A0A1Y3B3H1_EURMA|nr:hypothetical protein BLA29_004182 [Euroglyphus maynei]